MRIEQIHFNYIVSVMLILLLGCTKQTKDGVEKLSVNGLLFYQRLEEWNNGLTNTLNQRVLNVKEHSEFDEITAKMFQSVESPEERRALVRLFDNMIGDIPYDCMDYFQRDTVYSKVAKEYGAMIYVNYVIFKNPSDAMDVWFREIAHFSKEVSKCRHEYLRLKNLGEYDRAYDYEQRFGDCETRMMRIFYFVDLPFSIAGTYCQKYPSRKKELMERVKKAIGRYPRWYVDEIKEEAKQ